MRNTCRCRIAGKARGQATLKRIARAYNYYNYNYYYYSVHYYYHYHYHYYYYYYYNCYYYYCYYYLEMSAQGEACGEQSQHGEAGCNIKNNKRGKGG